MRTLVIQPEVPSAVNPVADSRTVFDEALAGAVAGDEIVLLPGAVYATRGAWSAKPPAYLNVPAGVTIRAGGATVRLVNPVRKTLGSNGVLVDRPDRDLPILWCGPEVRILGGTWDANFAAHDGWFTQGIRFFGRFEIQDARIIGMSGSKVSGTHSGSVEAFAISSEGLTAGSRVERVIVERCRVNSEDDYVSGIYLGSTVPSPDDAPPSRVVGCEVDFRGRGQFAYSSDEPTVFENCVGYASRFWYSDTSNTRGTRLMNCRGRGDYAAISAVAKDPTGPTLTNDHRELVVMGGDFDFPRAVEWWDQTTQKTMTGGVIAVDTNFLCRTPWKDRSGRLQAHWRTAIASRQGIVAFAGCRFSTENDFVDPQAGASKPANLDRKRLA